jgi:hypothetical protein
MLLKKGRIFPFFTRRKSLSLRSLCQATLYPVWFTVTGFFSVCSQLRQEGNCFFRPFVFKKFSASLTRSSVRQEVPLGSVRCEASYMSNHPSLPAPRAGWRGQGSGPEFLRRAGQRVHNRLEPAAILRISSSLSSSICQAKLFIGRGVMGNRILSGTPFMPAKANPLFFMAKKRAHTEGAARRGRKPPPRVTF